MACVKGTAFDSSYDRGHTASLSAKIAGSFWVEVDTALISGCDNQVCTQTEFFMLGSLPNRGGAESCGVWISSNLWSLWIVHSICTYLCLGLLLYQGQSVF